ncbi:lipoprotein-releasing ABC transporter ATP-binding protein LolD [Legionella oakridgensis]|uniref:Lipoprotein-releasing system ATP-binding protein LolD n=2 Tax=Legionella oakridgensis TaxID=29423 RepID=W0BA29_9GAMM|nr:lipoprotein-releasing ABC transporter ATP-binding protein LolD [Legionella oakridgensis]AHE67383.1 lipoprotein releasing system, ATP-binding protein [Legionella oakridgensis ATCC 33761 = DSM 21215]ETO93043.1 lipoprotein releasing system, ATP-binding protein [Legionella oakridgensis RV-2-2007]KTD43451.1 ABC transporter ATP binding protein [Legionella oakridgensis]STY20442.1 lipoprotein-releasing system ATP-binding protein [Legionella longbeachae]
MSKNIVSCRALSKSYHDGNTSIEVLKALDFTVNEGDRIAIVGPSGSGKSTLLHLLGGLDKPSDGQVFMQDINWQTLTEKQRCQVRNKYLGFIYQFHHLLPEFSALENIALPLLLAGQSIEAAAAAARHILEQVGLSAREEHKPAQLSGGERQRVAIARALVHQPQCVFADEPTGNLDHATAVRIFELMLHLNSQRNTALVIVTHDMELAKRMDRIMSLQNGCLIESL